MRDLDPHEAAQFRLAEAEESLAAARLAFTSGLYRSAVNRAYYAAFYAASAVLAQRGSTPKKHTGVQAELHRDQIRSGSLEARWGEVYTQLFEERLTGDYMLGSQFSAEDAEELVLGAVDFVARVRVLLSTPQGERNE